MPISDIKDEIFSEFGSEYLAVLRNDATPAE
jgi:hypothetical protein